MTKKNIFGIPIMIISLVLLGVLAAFKIQNSYNNHKQLIHNKAIVSTNSDAIINIGSRRELFVDKYLIAKSHDLELQLQCPTHKEIVMIYDKPWEGSGSDFQVIFRDGNIIRMYYTAAQLTNSDGTKMGGHPNYICYAESKDGIHWTKPDLGLFSFNGSKKNNIVWSMPHVDNFTPFKDTNPNVPSSERYKAVGLKDGALFAFKSKDGIHWSYFSDKPIITKGAFDSQNNAFWDPVRKQYWCYFRGFHNGIRDIRVSTSINFHTWTEPERISFVNSPDEALYVNQIRPYYRAPYLLLGFPTRYVERNFSKAAMQALPDPQHRQRRMKFSKRYGTAITDGLFMSSRNGYTFKRWNKPFIRNGIQRSNNWVYGDGYADLGLIQTSAEDSTAPPQLSFYVGEGHWKDDPVLRRYTIRIDGFVSLHAKRKTGEFTTKTFIFSGKTLSINFRTSVAGSIRVELEDKSGKPIPGFRLTDCDDIFGDTLDRTVTWNSRSDVSSLSGKPIRIRMTLSEADIYSFKFQ